MNTGASYSPARPSGVSARYALPAAPSSARLARHLIRTTLDGAPEPVVETAELLVSELVTNAVRHASSGPLLQIEREGDGVCVAVGDQSGQRPTVRHATEDDSGGRGLFLVDALARDWGWTPTDTGKRIWFRL